MQRLILTFLILLPLSMLLGCFTGCAPLRFSVEATAAHDELTETVVLGEGGWGTEKIALIDVSGLIADMRRPGLLASGENPVDRFAESLRKAELDSRVKAVVLRINSPGGAVTATDVMYRELMRFRATTGKPVVVLMADVAASGGMYLACGGDRIIAYPTTVTGSIGVIMQTFNVSEGMRRIGIRAEAITSGPNKALASPFEPAAEEHRVILQAMVDEFYAQFRAVVLERRPGLSADQIARVTDGRVVTGRDAAAIGLVDATGDLHDAFETARELAGLQRARLVKYHRPVTHVASPYAHAPAAGTGTQVNLVQVHLPGAGEMGETTWFYYLWDPSIAW